MKDIFILEGKKYISSRRASEISDYDPDYIGQLCRAGKLDCQRVGRAWFITEESLQKHKANVLQDEIVRNRLENLKGKKAGSQRRLTEQAESLRVEFVEIDSNNDAVRSADAEIVQKVIGGDQNQVSNYTKEVSDGASSKEDQTVDSNSQDLSGLQTTRSDKFASGLQSASAVRSAFESPKVVSGIQSASGLSQAASGGQSNSDSEITRATVSSVASDSESTVLSFPPPVAAEGKLQREVSADLAKENAVSDLDSSLKVSGNNSNVISTQEVGVIGANPAVTNSAKNIQERAIPVMFSEKEISRPERTSNILKISGNVKRGAIVSKMAESFLSENSIEDVMAAKSIESPMTFSEIVPPLDWKVTFTSSAFQPLPAGSKVSVPGSSTTDSSRTDSKSAELKNSSTDSKSSDLKTANVGQSSDSKKVSYPFGQSQSSKSVSYPFADQPILPVLKKFVQAKSSKSVWASFCNGKSHETSPAYLAAKALREELAERAMNQKMVSYPFGSEGRSAGMTRKSSSQSSKVGTSDSKEKSGEKIAPVLSALPIKSPLAASTLTRKIILKRALGVTTALVLVAGLGLASFGSFNGNGREIAANVLNGSRASILEVIDSTIGFFGGKYDAVVAFFTIKPMSLGVNEPAALGRPEILNATPADNSEVTSGMNGVAIVPSTGAADPDAALKAKIQGSFSDQVEVSPDQSGTTGVIRPVFKDSKGKDFIYVMVPVKDQKGTEMP